VWPVAVFGTGVIAPDASAPTLCFDVAMVMPSPRGATFDSTSCRPYVPLGATAEAGC
jgi:hypothetical protein